MAVRIDRISHTSAKLLSQVDGAGRNKRIVKASLLKELLVLSEEIGDADPESR
jgi:hypothetical protein